MLEASIVILLALGFFLVLRHYPEAKAIQSGEKRFGQNFRNLFAKVPKFPTRAGLETVTVAEPESASEGVTKPHRFGQLDPKVAEQLELAEEAFLRNDLREVEDRALDAIGLDKRCGEAYLLMAKVAYHRGQFDDTAAALKVALKCNKEIGETYYYLALLDQRNNNNSRAVENLEKAIVYEKGHADWYAELGKAYNEIRQFSKAAKVFKRAASMDIENEEYKVLVTEAESKLRSHSSYFRGR